VRHRWKVEGVHGEAKTWHGLARAVRRGLANMQIQAYGCSNSRTRDICENLITIRRDVVEASVLSGLKTHLMQCSQTWSRNSSRNFTGR
jgi:hypothetical protein